ncbi:unnamed protein product [Caenorhabditis nigoni]
MSLTDLPDLAISTILKKLDFRSMLNLRNVCHGLREFIDNTIPEFWISRIGITVARDKIDLHLEDVGSNNYSIRYPEEGLENFWDNFQRLLKHQREILSNFDLVLHFPEDEKKNEKSILEKVYAGFLDRLQSLLKSQKHPLKVQKLCLIVGDQNEIMSILPHLDSKELEILSIFPGRGEHMQIFKLDKVVETEQWKRAKELETVNFMVEESLEKFTHFSNCRIHITQTISQDIIEMLKENLQKSPNLQTFDLHFEPDHKSSVLRGMLRNVFQEAYVDETSLTNWYSRIPDSPEYILSARSSYFSWITFSRSKM